MFVPYNANPANNHVGDCVIRAVSKLTGQTWEETYVGILLQGFVLFDMPSANRVWTAYLRHLGYSRQEIPNTCPDCYTVRDFCRDHPKGSYLLSLDGHVVAVESGNYFDTWDSGSEPVIAYFFRKDDK